MGELTVSFQGGLADEHRLPAYAASQSLYGISRSLLVVTNYLGEGKVRHRNFDESGAHGFEINLVASGAVRNAVGIRLGEFSGSMKLSFQAARSIG